MFHAKRMKQLTATRSMTSPMLLRNLVGNSLNRLNGALKPMKIILIIAAALLALAVTAMAVFVFIVQNVETPVYQVVAQEGAFELRDYPPLVVAEVTREGARQTALRAGFSSLAGYIFAKERTGERVAMTAPVIQQRDDSIAMTTPVTQTPSGNGAWTVRFIMPAGYRRDTLPPPANAEVQLLDLPARHCAVVRFNGRATDELIAAQELALRDWIKARGLNAATAPIYAYYNDPWTPGFLRRNEVMIEVALPTQEHR